MTTPVVTEVLGSLRQQISRDISTLKDRLEVGRMHQSAYEGVGRDVILHQVNSMKRLLSVNATLNEQGEKASTQLRQALQQLSAYSSVTPHLLEMMSLITVVDHQITAASESIERLRSNMSILENRYSELDIEHQKSRATEWVEELGDNKKFQDALTQAFNKDLQDYYTMGVAAVPKPRHTPSKDLASIQVFANEDDEDDELERWLESDEEPSAAAAADESDARVSAENRHGDNNDSNQPPFDDDDNDELEDFLAGE